jgi:hypothetical protein
MRLFQDSDEVLTPFEYGMAYMPDWRHKLASDIARHSAGMLPATVAQDGVIRTQARYLRSEGREPMRPDENALFSIVNVLHDGTGSQMAKQRLESLLLTDLSMLAIATDMAMSLQQVMMYERLFFNIRDVLGAQSAPIGLRTNFALGPIGEAVLSVPTTPIDVLWKIKAVRAGASALLADFGWKRGACSEEVANEDDASNEVIVRHAANLLTEAYRGTASGKVLNDFFMAVVKREEVKVKKMEMEASLKATTDTVNEQSVVLHILEPLAPRLIPLEVTAEEVDDINSELIAKAGQVKQSGKDDTKARDKALSVLNEEISRRIVASIDKKE